MLGLLLLVQVADPIADSRALLAAERGCAVDPHSTDVTVCGMRNADRFRVPFVDPDPGDPAREAVADERRRLLARTTPIRELSPFLVGGGAAGVSMTTGGGKPASFGPRALAP